MAERQVLKQVQDDKQGRKIALVHDWLVNPGGAERVLLELHRMYPEAPIYTTAYVKERFPEFADADVRVTWMDKYRVTKYKHQFFSPLRALTYAFKDLSEYDLIISSASAESKYVRHRDEALHICYCHTPIRYYWSDYDWYRKNPPFGKLNWLAKIALPVMIGPLRWFDFKMSQRVSLYVANSSFVAARIRKYYHRESTVIYPPIVTNRFALKRDPKDYYVIVGRQVAYKRLDLAIDAFNELGLSLKISGSGEEASKQQLRSKENIEFLGRVSDEELSKLFSEAKAFIFPPEEDFGMIPVEAMSAGCPVIAYGSGGALESVVDGQTGVFFDTQTSQSLIEAVKRFETMTFDEKTVRARAAEFDVIVFRHKMGEYIETNWDKFEAEKKR
jgi:glycosyltransferase involved in cell wall biosynthesis